MRIRPWLLPALLLCRPAAAAPSQKLAVEDVIPLTEGNLRGHRMLYDEGWFVVSSSRKALDYARDRSIVSSREAIRRALDAASHRTAELGPKVKSDAGAAVMKGAEVTRAGTERSGEILRETRALSGREVAYADESFRRAAESFVRGNLSIAKRTEEDRRELAALPGGWFKDVKADFGNVYELAAAARKRFAERISPAWEESFRRASEDFRMEYERSARQPNALAALGPILRGWLKAFYRGLAAPASKTLVRSAETGASAVFLPASAAAIVTGRTVESAGLTLYYAGRAGVKLVSPTVESGLFAGMALLSLAAAPPTAAGGAALGAVNQVAFTAAGPAVGAARAATAAATDSGAYVAGVLCDGADGLTKVAINQASAGLVLGYNALTAVPTQALLGASDAVIFLGWDGPRLVIAAARGKLGTSGSVADLPAGTVVDLKALGKTDGIEVKTISDEPAVIKNVLERIPEDARAGDGVR